MSAVFFLPKAKRRAKRTLGKIQWHTKGGYGWDESVSLCEKRSWNAPLYFFFLPLLKTDFCQNLKDILFLFGGATRDGDETLKRSVYKPVRCVLLIEVTKRWRRRLKGLQNTLSVFTVGLTYRGAADWSWHVFKPLRLMQQRVNTKHEPSRLGCESTTVGAKVFSFFLPNFWQLLDRKNRLSCIVSKSQDSL